MSTDARTASPSPLTKSAVPDEAALKRTFDADFDASLASAKSQLADATQLAPKVVENAFVAVWNRRGTIATTDQLKAVLAEEIKHSAARALSRRSAAGRLAAGKQTTGAHATTPSAAPADVWANVSKTINTSASSQSHAVHDKAGRHEAASHMRMAARKKSYVVPIIIFVVALGLSVGGMMYVSSLGEDDAMLAAANNTQIQPFVASNPGQTASFTLPDSTKVQIGPESKLFVPDGFPVKTRVVRLEGTAQFQPGPLTEAIKGPFRVVAKRNLVATTGTIFAVSAFPGDSVMFVTVKEGTVRVKSMKTEAALAANQTMFVERGTTRDATANEKAEHFSWLDGHVTVPPKQLRHVLESLSRWFSVDVKVVDMPLLDREASFDVPLNETAQAITAVEKSANLRSTNEGGNRVFRDAGKKK
jgi:ferric-dicitrate binding protein FerR (iron transport regulator)